MGSLEDLIRRVSKLLSFDEILELVREGIDDYFSDKTESKRTFVSMLCSVVLCKEIDNSKKSVEEKEKDLPPDLKELFDRLKEEE